MSHTIVQSPYKCNKTTFKTFRQNIIQTILTILEADAKLIEIGATRKQILLLLVHLELFEDKEHLGKTESAQLTTNFATGLAKIR